MRKRGYTRTIESLWRVMRREGWTAQGEKKKTLQTQTLRANAIPRSACSDRREGRTPTLYCRPAAEAVSVHRHRRVFPLSRLGAYEEQSTFSSADFLSKVVKHFARKGIAVECVQTDNGFEFTNRFSGSRRDLETLFEATARQLGIRHKLIRPYTPRHNGKVET